MIQIKRAYDPPEKSDGARFLVDRLWPRGVSKEDLQFEEWLKDIAPSDSLRKWFDHDPEKWKEFQERYKAELDEHADDLAPILEAAKKRKTVTILVGARDTEHNNGVVLKAYLEGLLSK